MISIARPHIGEAEIEAVVAVMRSGHLAQGAVVAEFERRFAGICGVDHAIATTSGTTALHLALLAHGIGPGDEVITTSFSFIASANCILYVGATPVFADIEPETFNIDPDDVEWRITSKTRAIIPVHLYGNPAGLARLQDICRRHGLVLIEDACQAHAATYQGQTVGSFGTGCFSFYPTKNVMSGEGGIIKTNDDAVAEKARLLRAHGMPQRYVHEILGYNFRLSDLHAAIGLTQLDNLAAWTARRQENARRLRDALGDIGMGFQATAPDATHVYHQFTIRIESDRDEVRRYLAEHGVGSEIYYPIPIHQQQLYRELGYDISLPHTELASREVLSLPVHPALADDDVDTVARTVRMAVEHVRQPLAAD